MIVNKVWEQNEIFTSVYKLYLDFNTDYKYIGYLEFNEKCCAWDYTIQIDSIESFDKIYKGENDIILVKKEFEEIIIKSLKDEIEYCQKYLNAMKGDKKL